MEDKTEALGQAKLNDQRRLRERERKITFHKHQFQICISNN